MLRINVGLSRKLSKDYNSTGYSVNLDGEITAPVSDSEAVVEQVKELFDLAEEVLDIQVERSQGDSAIASRDETPQGQMQENRDGNGANEHGSNGNGSQPASRQAGNSPGNGNGNGNGQQEPPATNKQVQFLLNLGKKQQMSKRQLQDRVTEILGYNCDVYNLTKRNAGIILDNMTNGNGSRA